LGQLAKIFNNPGYPRNDRLAGWWNNRACDAEVSDGGWPFARYSRLCDCRLTQSSSISINQSIKQVYCTEPCHTHTINLTNKNKREKSHT